MSARGFIILSATSLTLFAGCRPQNVYQPPPPPTVTVAKPLRQNVIDYLEETGTTEAVAMVEIRARVRGYLEKVNFEPGAFVKEGDLLYLIQQPEFQAKVLAGNAELEAAKARRDRAKIESDRQVNLQTQSPGATSEVAVEAARAEYRSAEAGVQGAEASLKQAQLDLDYTEVKSPINGRVGKTLVKAGNLVGDNEATQLTTVINYDPIYANFNISERALLMLREQTPRSEQERTDIKSIKVQLRRVNDKGFPFDGHLDYAGLAVNQSTGTYLIRGIFSNPNRDIVPGLFVRVRFPIDVTENAILVPERAFSVDQAGRFLLVVDAENTVQRRNVISGAKYEDLLVVEEGLKGDELVVIDGIQRARPGAKVDPKQETLAQLEETLKRVEEGSPAPLDSETDAAVPGSPRDASNASNTPPTPDRP